MDMDLAALKHDLSIPPDDTRDDVALQQSLDATLDFIRDKRSDLNWDADPDSELPAPTDTHKLGVIRLAGRWNTRRRSPDGLIQAGELGSSRVPSVDPDIERMLGIGRYHAPVFA